MGCLLTFARAGEVKDPVAARRRIVLQPEGTIDRDPAKEEATLARCELGRLYLGAAFHTVRLFSAHWRDEILHGSLDLTPLSHGGE